MELLFQNGEHIQLLQNYQLSSAQLKNTMHPKDCILLANEDHNRNNIVVMDGDKCVAFFVLHIAEGVKPYSNNPNSILFRAFSVQQYLTDRGIGSFVMKQLPQFVRQHFPTADEIILCVNCLNERAIHVYEKMNYIKAEGTVEGRQGPMYVMHYPL